MANSPTNDSPSSPTPSTLSPRPALASAASGNEVTQQLIELRAAINQLSGIVAQGGALAHVREVEVALAVCGRGGSIFIATYDRPPPLGTPMRVRIDFTGGDHCEIRGRVRYHQDELGEGAPAGYGVEFTHVELEAAALIEAFARLRALG